MDSYAIALIGVGGSFGGALVGELSAYWLSARRQQQRERRERTLRLLELYNSPEVLKARRDTDRILETYFEEHPPCSWNELYHALGDEWGPITVVEHFYQQLLHFHECGELEDDLAKTFWGREYAHWYGKHFGKIDAASTEQREAPDGSTARRLINWLRK